MRLYRWVAARQERVNSLAALPGVAAVLLAAAYYGAWWAVALTLAMEAALIRSFRLAWERAQRSGGE